MLAERAAVITRGLRTDRPLPLARVRLGGLQGLNALGARAPGETRGRDRPLRDAGIRR